MLSVPLTPVSPLIYVFFEHVLAVMVQNGSFFYPKKVGFRPTAVYTAVLGERDLKHYVQEPGGQQTLCLGTSLRHTADVSLSVVVARGMELHSLCHRGGLQQSWLTPLSGCFARGQQVATTPRHARRRFERRTKPAPIPRSVRLRRMHRPRARPTSRCVARRTRV